MATLPREVIKWLQSLDLSHSVTKPRRDVANGVLVAEILSRYVTDVPLHGLDSSSSTARKVDNWRQLEKSLIKARATLDKDLVDGTIQCREGASVALLKLMFTQLTGRTIQTLPPLQAEEADITNIPKVSKMKVMKEMTTLDSLALQQTPTVTALKKESPTAAAAKATKSPAKVAVKAVVTGKMQAIKAPTGEGIFTETPTAVAFSTVTVRPVDLYALTDRRSNQSSAGAVGPSRGKPGGVKSEGDVFLFLSQCVQDAFRKMGMYTDANLGDKAFHSVVDANSEYPRNAAETAWGTVFLYVRRLVDIVASSECEFIKLLAAMSFLWDRELRFIGNPTWDLHCEKARMLIAAVGEDLGARDASNASDLMTKYLLPRCVDALRDACGPVRHNVVRMLSAFLTNASVDARLTFLRTLQDRMCSTTGLPDGPLLPLGPFLRALAAFTSTESLAITVDVQIANAYIFYASVALRGTSPASQCAALVLMERLLAAGYVEVLRDAKYLVEMAETSANGGVHWEVTAQLVILTRTLLEVGPSDEVYDIAHVLLSVSGGRYLRAFTLCNMAAYITDDKPEMCAQFFDALFGLPAIDRMRLLDGDASSFSPPTLDAAEAYSLPSLTNWDTISAVNSVVGFLLQRRVPMKEALQVIEIITRTNTQSADMHTFWMNFIVQTQDDFSKALAIRGHAPGLVDAETKDLCFGIAKKLFVDLSGISIKAEDPAIIQRKVIDWYRAVLQHSM